jgi:DedD protein
MDETDAQLQLKKRARRRLVGAVAFVSVVAVVLPVMMDHEPRQQVQDVEIRIPGQDEKPFAPKFAVAPVEKAPEIQPPESKAPVEPVVPSKPQAAKELPVIDKIPEKPVDKPVEKPSDKALEKVVAKPEKPVEKTAEKAPEKAPAKADSDAKRAAAILSGQMGDVPHAAAAQPAKAGEFVVLIGAFSNEANVKILKTKLGELNIKSFSEPLDTPQGKKTRLRAGPFPNREAAEKAHEKMQKIGVPGVVSAK